MDLSDNEMDRLAIMMCRARIALVRMLPDKVKRSRRRVTLALREIDPLWQALCDKGAVRIDHCPDDSWLTRHVGSYLIDITDAGRRAFNTRWDEERRLARERRILASAGGT